MMKSTMKEPNATVRNGNRFNQIQSKITIKDKINTMKQINIAIIYLCSLIIISILFSCEDELKPDYDFFLIKVDSIQITENITANDSFHIKLFGTIGTNGCYQFSHFNTTTEDNDIRIESWGKVDKNRNICPGVMVYLDDEKLNYTIKEKGTYKIKVKQPDNKYLEKQIKIE